MITYKWLMYRNYQEWTLMYTQLGYFHGRVRGVMIVIDIQVYKGWKRLCISDLLTVWHLAFAVGFVFLGSSFDGNSILCLRPKEKFIHYIIWINEHYMQHIVVKTFHNYNTGVFMIIALSWNTFTLGGKHNLLTILFSQWIP